MTSNQKNYFSSYVSRGEKWRKEEARAMLCEARIWLHNRAAS